MPHNPHILHLTRTAHLPRSPLTHTANHLHDCKALEPSRNLALTLTLKLSLTLTPTLTLTVTPMLTLTPCKRRFAFSSTKHQPTSIQQSKQCHQIAILRQSYVSKSHLSEISQFCSWSIRAMS